jgi:hypothetical protein
MRIVPWTSFGLMGKFVIITIRNVEASGIHFEISILMMIVSPIIGSVMIAAESHAINVKH